MIVGVETGGTKVVCAAAPSDAPQHPLRTQRFATTTPRETLGHINAFLAEVAATETIEALGIGSFGPINADPTDEHYGWITTTPKPGWRNVDVLGRIRHHGAPAAFVSDVTAAAIGEQRWGAGRGVDELAYITVGTGIGVGLVTDGAPSGGNGWPELGHILIRRHPQDTFAGSCPYHADCLEGLASGPAVQQRWGTDASSFQDRRRDSPLEILGFYIAQLVYTVVLATGTVRVVLSGGVMLAPGLLDAVRAALPSITQGYGPPQLVTGKPDHLVVGAALEGLSGVVGALTLASGLANLKLRSSDG